ncbi:proline-rich receptor-like protein kinase PERK9 [Trichogramma pretiosum]|uniref:proline-rich receptor-like protein kinase PERK9 n=1 Tax=Trichogramma pretiosum TaxID=7493 RepID=UPI000C71A46F|nr:proline-rich receptor-like protein kinase PERK9 [Trichogramma pretiosum]
MHRRGLVQGQRLAPPNVVAPEPPRVAAVDDANVLPMPRPPSPQENVVAPEPPRVDAVEPANILLMPRPPPPPENVVAPEPPRVAAADPENVLPMPLPPPPPIGPHQSSDPCVVCMTENRTHCFLPCGHYICCLYCTERVLASDTRCPACRGESTGFLRIFQ